MRRDNVPSEAEIAAAIDRLLSDVDEGAASPIDTWPPLDAGDRAVDYAKRAADMVITAPSIMGNRRGWLKVPGTDRGGVAFDVGERHVDLAVADVRAMLAAELQAAHAAGVAERDAEVAALRQIISDAAREVGAQVSPECSLDFMALLPREIALAIRRAEGGR